MNEWQAKLNEYWAKLNEWWNGLALREKQVVAVGGTAVAIFILYAGIWSPLLNAVTSMRGKIVTGQKTLIWMQAADREMQKVEKESTDKSKPITPVALLSLLQKQIADAELAQQLTQLKQSSNDSIDVHFAKVDFDKVMHLLTALVKEHSVSIAQMSAMAGDTPGIANIDIVLKLN